MALPDTIARGPLALGFFGDAPKVSPTRHNPDTVYRWLDYNELDATAAAFTSPGSEVTSIAQLARSLCEPPRDFTEWYFPTRLALDLQQKTAPSIAANTGPAAHPNRSQPTWPPSPPPEPRPRNFPSASGRRTRSLPPRPIADIRDA
ncbi:hypothetical protein [Nocardia sp. NPDC051750]|uniref:hypothetical protein n=1 Tax=Nocardia sp. NPDC051750 TaxID=3364325 RepID=UPI00378A870B